MSHLPNTLAEHRVLPMVLYAGSRNADDVTPSSCFSFSFFHTHVEFSTISTLESVISVSSDYLCIDWYGSSLGVYTRVGVPRLQCLGQ